MKIMLVLIITKIAYERTILTCSEDEFLKHFRVSRRIAQNLARRYESSGFYKSGSGQFGNISPLRQVLVFLWFAGHQTSSFRAIADKFCISISSLHRIVRKVTLFLSSLSPEIIKWPSEDEKLAIRENFERNGFPDVIGVIDGIHISIDKPTIDPDTYINKKGFFSIQMQAVCDHKMRFTDVFIGCPGSAPDSGVLQNSSLFQTLAEKCGTYFILGDSCYPLLSNLLTPYKDRQLSKSQINYNTKLSQNRSTVDHAFAILKEKFRQLNHVKLRNMTYIEHFIRACCVLHNISIDDVFEVNYELEFTEETSNEEGSTSDTADGIAARDQMAATLLM
ncbi:putative nuclease HARBI1 [Cimex lectularius]|uniref:DDE Tnp4 domain-containing protein n=1 Tax=Cimex lectularius TaxID=79782 RepID=A0A8I6TIF2_CIMLE|nr:putative nuclease HARBI1 [Cimex lectularius]